ncbi:MAG: hypothetical protein AB1705_19310 [Verrucomicrobiota bacterium]
MMLWRRGFWLSLLLGSLFPISLDAAEVAGQGTTTAAVAGSGAVEDSAIRDAGALYQNVFRDLTRGVNRGTRLGYGQGDVRIPSPLQPGFQVPLMSWGARPEDADLKLGNFYLDVRDVSASMLYSDNVELNDAARRDGFIAVVETHLSFIFQINEGLRIGAGMGIVYLPLQNEIGFGDIAGILGFGLSTALGAQITYDVPLGGWDFQFFDQAGIDTLGFTESQAFDLFDTGPVKEDRAGTYAFRTPSDLTGVRESRDELLEGFTVVRNIAGVTTTRVLPTVTRLTATASHSDYWYLNNAIPETSQDSLEILLASERENMRFKPYAGYTTWHVSNSPGWDQVVRGGVHGPITENMDFLGDIGYYIPAGSAGESYLWTLSLSHRFNPRTHHFVVYQRNVTEPARGVQETLAYGIDRDIGPDLTGSIRLRYQEFDDLTFPNGDRVDYSAGVSLRYTVQPRHSLLFSGSYYKLNYPNSAALGDNQIWIGRLDYSLKVGETVDLIVGYQYTDWDSTGGGRNYRENLVIITLRKTL